MSSTFHLAFHDLPDPRAQNRHYSLLELLFITICAMCAGADDFDEVVDWAKLHREFLREFLPSLGPIATPITFRRLFASLDPYALELGFARWAGQTVPKPPKGTKRLLAGDGKSLRGSFTQSDRTDMFHNVSLMCHAYGLMVATTGSASKGHEIEDLRTLLRLIELSDTVVTTDALHTTVATARLIVEQGGDYLMPLKENCPARLAEAQLLFEDALQGEQEMGWHHSQTNDGHGRVEERHAWSAAAGEWFGEPGQWSTARSVMRLERVRSVAGEESREVSYWVSSLAPEEIELLHQATRGHWSIENQGNWVLDVILKEDASRLRRGEAARNVGVMRRIALNLLKQDKRMSCSLKRKRYQAGMSTEILRKLIRPLISQVPLPGL